MRTIDEYMRLPYRMEIIPDTAEGGYVVRFPELPGCLTCADTLEEAVRRARTVAAPLNQQRFLLDNPCSATGTCADCKSPTCICNQIIITRNCRPAGRIKFIIVGEELGF